ncbi:MAG: heavy metal translocating P-type ATPase [Proteobacteria bacterium]|nr:heavy metal translocating P-type ATPase [Pseudomonadota bacterium]
MKEQVFGIKGLHCASCVNRLETKLRETKGVISASVNLATAKANIKYDPHFISVEGIKSAVKSAGYEAYDLEPDVKIEEELSRKRKNFIFSLIFALPLAFFTMTEHFHIYKFFHSEVANSLFQLVLATPVLYFGREFYVNGIRSVIRSKTATMDTLVALGTGTAYLYSLFVTVMIFLKKEGYDSMHLYYETSAVLIMFILLGRNLEAKARGKTSLAIKKLIELSPKYATVIRDGKEVEIPISEVKVNDIVIVKSGQRIPVDGVVLEGYSSVDESMITGESIPVEKKKGDKVLAGTINKMGTFTMEASSVGENTVLSQIIKLVESAQSSKAPIQKMADKISSVFVPVVIICAILSFIFWKSYGFDTYFALKTLISVLIIACPCSLGLAAPTAVIVGTGMGAERGILFKNAESIEKLASIDTIVLDKTGTLTFGKPEVVKIFSYIEEGIFLKIISSLEKASNHPLAEAILKKYGKDDFYEVTKFETVPGMGVLGYIKGDKVYLGSLDFIKDKGFNLPELDIEEGFSYIYVGIEKENEKKLLGYMALFDNLRDDAGDFINNIRNLNIDVIMLTGDNEKVAEKVAKRLNITNYRAKVLPQEKQKIISDLKANGRKVAMIGDGINDAPALASADVGIAIGSGTDIAIEAGEIVIVKPNLMTIYKGVVLSKEILSKIKQNFFWAFIYNTIGIPIAGGILYPFWGLLLNPMFAGLAMAFSSVSVVTNSLLLKRNKI